MELKVSSLKREGLSPADCVSDPEEKEVSDEDDDDRNHKHRRRETRSQSSERESLEPVFSRSYRKHNKPFENGHPFRQNESAANESWKNYNNAPLERDFSTKFDKSRPGLMSLSRVPMDMNQRMRPNQYFPGELGPGRGRGRDHSSWSQRDSRFSPIDLASQIVQQGPIAPSLFPGRGLGNVSNPQGASWNGFGLIPGIPNGGLDTLHPIALPGTLRPSLNSSLNMGIPHQRCRDFEERGFCLRGDMCPMEHGVNRIVVEDVQSLSQFNLPVSLPSSQLAGTAAGPGGLQSVGAPSSTLMNSKPTQGRSSKSGMVDDSLGLNGDYPSMSGADLYDPDQPLWNNGGPETSSGILRLHSPKNDETESLMGVDLSDHVGSQGNSSSVWGRIHTSKKRLDLKEKNDLAVSNSDYLEIESKDDQDALTNVQGTSRQGKRIITGDMGLRHVDSSTKTQISSTRNSVRKPSQKALRTLFVNSIPQKSNKRESLLSHFQKFGEVIDIYIPLNSERAFVQFSKREEAEAALRAPDAVMGNRFIKLWWANRDSIPDDGMGTSTDASVTSHGGTAASGLAHPSAGNSGNENLQPLSSKGAMSTPNDSSVTAPDNQRVILANGPKVPPPSQKKLESLEQLKEDIRKKQELLDQKRNDFRRKLDKLAKQSSGAVAEPSGKRQKVGTLADVAKPSAPSSSDPTSAVVHLHADISVDKNYVVENVVSASPKTVTSQQDPTISKQSIRPLGPIGPSIPMNRYKLDNRPRSFRIITPLPAGLRNVAALKEYFSSYGDISALELEGGEPHSDNDNDNTDESEVLENRSVRLTFTTRQSAEKAFLNGKNWQGNNLKFTWVTSSTSSNDTGEKKKSSTSKDAVDADIQPVEGLTRLDSVKVLGSGSGEHENSGQDGVDNMEMVEVPQPCEALISGERESPRKELCPSPKREHSPTSISGGEESIQPGSDPTATSEQKQSPNGVVC